MKSPEVAALFSSRSHSSLLRRRRAVTIVALTRSLALLFAVLTLAWILVDVAVFESRLAAELAVVRLVTAGAFFVAWLVPPRDMPGLVEARTRLALLFAIPAAFYATTQTLLRGTGDTVLEHGIAAAYALIPYAMAAGISAFPLVLVESAALAALCFALLGWTSLRDARFVPDTMILDALWLLVLISGACAFAGMSQVRLLAALLRQATRDPLTGCLRRESGSELLDSHFRLSERMGMPLAVLFADLDRFKAVNDEWGHEVGDQVLANAAGAIREAARESDIVLRWGGEEFVAVLPGADAGEALLLLDRLRSAGGTRLPDGSIMTLSVGIAERVADGAPGARELVDLADRRMYLAKQAGRNRCVHSPSGEARVILGAGPLPKPGVDTP